jgi:hypothetical protein
MTQLKFGNGDISVTGAIAYSSRKQRGLAVGVLLQVGVNDYPAEVIVDTGAPFLVCTPQLAKAIGIEDAKFIRKDTILFRGLWLDGSLYELTVAFAPDENMGSGAALAVSGFVPANQEGLEEVLPYSSLGWVSCLEATPFAIDPGRKTFYYC